MNGKQRWRTWRAGLLWLALLLGFYGFGNRMARLFAAVYPLCVDCDCANVNFWAVNPYTTQVGDFDMSDPKNPVSITNAIIGINAPASTGCYGNGSGQGPWCEQWKVKNVVYACDPLVSPGFPRMYNAGTGGATLVSKIEDVHQWICK